MKYFSHLLILLGLALFGARPHAQPANCGLQLGTTVAFCDTFDQPSAINSRAGQLNSVIWGVSRAIGAVNLGQSSYNQWASTLLQKCDGTVPRVIPPNDVIICNGQLREASNDNISGVFDAGDVTVLAMYPKQPFDFAARTGTVSFDVSNDTHSIHAAWPEFWITDLPIPAPFTHLNSWIANPQHGFGVRFGAEAQPGQLGMCPNGNNLSVMRWTVDSAVIIRNYAMEDTFTQNAPTGTTVTQFDCVISPTGPGQLNHVEVRISQNQIDVYASDAGTTTPLKHLAVISQANLTLSRGLIWLEDVHYNADKGDTPSQREHTFAWDNVAFDGPFTYRDLSFDALDALTPGANGAVNLGKPAAPNAATSWNVLNLPADRTAAAQRLLFNFYCYFPPSSVTVTVNGHAHVQPWPYPDQQSFTWRTLAVSIPASDLVTGTNVVTIGGTTDMVVSNVNIVLVNTGTAPPPPPPVSITIAPTTVSIMTGANQTFVCTVTGASNTGCTWAVTEGAGGGTITSGGLYTAPSTIGTFHVKTTSVADTSKTATATVTVTAAPICPSAYPNGQPVAIVTNGTTVYSTFCQQ